MAKEIVLGVDVGASGIKGALIDISNGEMQGERFRLPTPKPALPKTMAKTFAEVVQHFKWDGIVGCGFPAIVRNGIAESAANIDKLWIGTDVAALFEKHAKCPVYVANDADLAGVAEMNFGSGKTLKNTGTVLFITIGSGLGSALFYNGELVPNTELGHLFLKNHSKIVERFAADSIRKKEDLSWSEWGKRFNQFLVHIERLFSPDLIMLGGGASKKFHLFSNQIKTQTEVQPAQLLNHAGIIGASAFAYKKKSMRIASKTF